MHTAAEYKLSANSKYSKSHLVYKDATGYTLRLTGRPVVLDIIVTTTGYLRHCETARVYSDI